jgi:predicted nucleotidyltransferase
MSSQTSTGLTGLPEAVQVSLNEFAESAKKALGPDVVSIVLFGSAAEGRLRATSDVNLMLVLSVFDPVKMDALRESLEQARAVIKLAVMFILKSEMAPASAAFAVKFADIQRRRRVLFGADPFIDLQVSRQASIDRLKQTLFNGVLRLRAAYVYGGSREEQLSYTIADFTGPLRACAASILELEGQPAPHPKEALEKLASMVSFKEGAEVLTHASETRERRFLPRGTAGATLLKLIELAQLMQKRVDTLR